MSGDVGILRDNKGFQEAHVYYNLPSLTRVPDEIHNEHLIGIHSFILYYMSLMNLRLGIPTYEPIDRTLTIVDNGGSLICSNNPTFTVNADICPGFGVAAKGDCSFVGADGVVISDVRTTGEINPWCALMQTEVMNKYDIVGTKA